MTGVAICHPERASALFSVIGRELFFCHSEGASNGCDRRILTTLVPPSTPETQSPQTQRGLHVYIPAVILNEMLVFSQDPSLRSG